MPTCSQCRNYKPIDAESGICFGHQVSGDTDAEDCPTHSFVPIKETEDEELG